MLLYIFCRPATTDIYISHTMRRLSFQVFIRMCDFQQSNPVAVVVVVVIFASCYPISRHKTTITTIKKNNNNNKNSIYIIIIIIWWCCIFCMLFSRTTSIKYALYTVSIFECIAALSIAQPSTHYLFKIHSLFLLHVGFFFSACLLYSTSSHSHIHTQIHTRSSHSYCIL